MEFLTALKSKMPTSYVEQLGAPKFFGIKNAKVQVAVKPGTTWELRGIVGDAVEMGSLELKG
ncbi:MAG: hypothetical protein ACKPKO_15345, partial [Candidatus Fonsibacter sp.]